MRVISNVESFSQCEITPTLTLPRSTGRGDKTRPAVHKQPMALVIDNSIAYAHFRLRGGWRGMLIFCGGYAGLVAGTMLFSTRMDPHHLTMVYNAWTVGLLAMQMLLVMFIGGAFVAGAIRRDVTSKMHESHRLMPVAPFEAIVGYMLGGGGLMAGFGAVNLLIGIGTCIQAGVAIDRWLIANALLGIFIAFIWTLTALCGFFSRNLFLLNIILMVLGVFSQGMILWILPGLSVVLSPLAGHSVFALRADLDGMLMSHVLGIGAQVSFGVIFFLAAMRKYRRPEQPAFTPMLALVLLFAWVAFSMVGMQHWDDVGPDFLRFRGPEEADRPATQLICSMMAGLLLGYLPLGAAIRAAGVWRDHRRLDDPAVQNRSAPASLMGMMVLAILMMLTALAVPPNGHSKNQNIALTALCLMFSLATVGFLLGSRRRRGVNGNGMVVAWTMTAWLVPLLLDVIRHAISIDDNDPAFTSLFASTPAGTLMALWYSGTRTDIGLSVQALLALAAGAIYLRALRWERANGDQHRISMANV